MVALLCAVAHARPLARPTTHKETVRERRPWTLGAGSALLTGLLAGTDLPALARNDDAGEFTVLHAHYGTERNHVDATGRLRDLARRDQRFTLENEVCGVHPDHGRTRTLRIFGRDRSGRAYRRGNERTRTVRVNEGDWLRLP